MAGSAVNIALGVLGSGSIVVSVYNLNTSEPDMDHSAPEKIIEVQVDQPALKDGLVISLNDELLKSNAGEFQAKRDSQGKPLSTAILKGINDRPAIKLSPEQIGKLLDIPKFTTPGEAQILYPAVVNCGRTDTFRLQLNRKGSQAVPQSFPIQSSSPKSPPRELSKVSRDLVLSRNMDAELIAESEGFIVRNIQSPNSLSENINMEKWSGKMEWAWEITSGKEPRTGTFLAKIRRLNQDGELVQLTELKTGQVTAVVPPQKGIAKYAYAGIGVGAGALLMLLFLNLGKRRKDTSSPPAGVPDKERKTTQEDPKAEAAIKKAIDLLDSLEYDLFFEHISLHGIFEKTTVSAWKRQWNKIQLEDSRGELTRDQKDARESKLMNRISEKLHDLI